MKGRSKQYFSQYNDNLRKYNQMHTLSKSQNSKSPQHINVSPSMASQLTPSRRAKLENILKLENQKKNFISKQIQKQLQNVQESQIQIDKEVKEDQQRRAMLEKILKYQSKQLNRHSNEQLAELEHQLINQQSNVNVQEVAKQKMNSQQKSGINSKSQIISSQHSNNNTHTAARNVNNQDKTQPNNSKNYQLGKNRVIKKVKNGQSEIMLQKTDKVSTARNNNQNQHNINTNGQQAQTNNENIIPNERKENKQNNNFVILDQNKFQEKIDKSQHTIQFHTPNEMVDLNQQNISGIDLIHNTSQNNINQQNKLDMDTHMLQFEKELSLLNQETPRRQKMKEWKNQLDDWDEQVKQNTELFRQEQELQKMKEKNTKKEYTAMLSQQVERKNEEHKRQQEALRQQMKQWQDKFQQYEALLQQQEDERKQSQLQQREVLKSQVNEIQSKQEEERRRMKIDNKIYLKQQTKNLDHLKKEERQRSQDKQEKQKLIDQLNQQITQSSKHLNLKQKHEDKILTMQYSQLLDQNEKQRLQQQENLKQRLRQDELRVQAATSVVDQIHQRKHKLEEMENARVQEYFDRRNQQLKQEEVMRQINKRQMVDQMQRQLDEQIAEKHHKEIQMKQFNNEQASIWQKEDQDYQEGEMKKQALKKQINSRYAALLEEQMQEKSLQVLTPDILKAHHAGGNVMQDQNYSIKKRQLDSVSNVSKSVNVNSHQNTYQNQHQNQQLIQNQNQYQNQNQNQNQIITHDDLNLNSKPFSRKQSVNSNGSQSLQFMRQKFRNQNMESDPNRYF